jgi:1-acyl-sn-glycerol-3-phosphate acyltransferase
MQTWQERGKALLDRLIPWLVYQATWQISMFVGLFFVRLRVSGVSCFPVRGSVLLLSNHQSFLDPPLLGVSIPRQARYAARSTLFKGFFAKIITYLGAIALDREGSSGKGLRESLRALGSREALIYFPEGTRTEDGKIGSLQRGTGLLIRRSGSTVVLAGIAGAFEAWPRGYTFPRRGVVWIHYESWNIQQADSKADEDILRSISERMKAIFDEATRRREAYIRRQKIPLVGPGMNQSASAAV